MISTCIDRTKGLVTHTGSGELSAEEITKAFKARLENQDYRTGMKVLWDCSGATLSSLSTQGVRQLVALNARHADDRGEGMTAIVVSRDVDYGVGRMFEIHAYDLPWHTTVFRDLESAMRWLGCPEQARPPVQAGRTATTMTDEQLFLYYWSKVQARAAAELGVEVTRADIDYYICWGSEQWLHRYDPARARREGDEPQVHEAIAKIRGSRRDTSRPAGGEGGIDWEMTKGSQTVLVADNELLVREPIVLALRQAGYKILVAGDSQDTVAVFSEHAEEIVAVLLDCHMPGGPGEEVFEELHRIRPDIPVIMMSGPLEEEVMGRFLGMGIVGFLQKPFEQVTLLDKVRKAIEPPAA